MGKFEIINYRCLNIWKIELPDKIGYEVVNVAGEPEHSWKMQAKSGNMVDVTKDEYHRLRSYNEGISDLPDYLKLKWCDN